MSETEEARKNRDIWMTIEDAFVRGVEWKGLSREKQKLALVKYIYDTRDVDVEDMAWIGIYGYHPITGEGMGDDPVSADEWAKVERWLDHAIDQSNKKVEELKKESVEKNGK